MFAITPPANAKVQEITFSEGDGKPDAQRSGERPTVTTHGHGPATIAVIETRASRRRHIHDSQSLEGLPKVTINGASATELRTELGTLLTFERSGMRYLVGGWVAPAAVEEVARGL